MIRFLRNYPSTLHSALTVSTLLVLTSVSGSVASSSNHTRSRLRLPDTIIPTHYDLRLQPFLGINDTIDGLVSIQLSVLRNTSSIRIHLQRITIKPRGIKLVSNDLSERVAIRASKKDRKTGMTIIKVRGKLQPNANYTLRIAFTSKLYHEPKGFYSTAYWMLDDRQRFVAATQFWTANARRAFPCFDEPSLKATFDITLGRQQHMTAIANTPIRETSPIPNQPGWFFDKFERTEKMSTYLLAFVISEFSNITIENKARVRVFARDDILERSSHAISVGDRSINFFEQYLNSSLAVPKIDMVGLPLTAHHGMENWGLVTFRESSLSYSSEDSTASGLLLSTELVVHEMAHQWFGNLVTFEWWTDLWLSEGFATYMAAVAIQELFPAWKSMDYFCASRLRSVMVDDSSLASHPVRTHVADPNDINEVFDAIPYSKGASIIRMMQHFLTEDTFMAGVKNYLNKFKFSSASQENFFGTMNEAAENYGVLFGGISLNIILDTWTLQAGYPVLFVNRPDNSTATLKQRRFHFGMSNTSDVDVQKWWIPVTFTDQRYPYFEHTQPRTWLRPQDDQLPVTGLPPLDKWVLFNLQQTGYFRVNYDLGNWHLLLIQLLTDHKVLPDVHRAQLIDDSFNLARAGLVPYHVPLNITRYLREEVSLVPWLAAFNNFKYLNSMLRSSPLYGALKGYLKWAIRPALETVGLRDNIDDNVLVRLLRTHLEDWACQLDLPECQQLVNDLEQVLMNNSTLFSDTSFDRGGGTFCAAVRRGGEVVWTAVWRLFSHTANPARREALGQALGCTREAWLINRYLQSGLRGAELVDALRWTRQTDVGLEVAWQYVWNHRKALIRTPEVFPSIIKTLAQDFHTEHHQFMLSEQLKLTSVDIRHSLAGVIQAVENNVNWHQRSYAQIKRWLEEAGFPAGVGETFNYRAA